MIYRNLNCIDLRALLRNNKLYIQMYIGIYIILCTYIYIYKLEMVRSAYEVIARGRILKERSVIDPQPENWGSLLLPLTGTIKCRPIFYIAGQ